MAELQDMPPGWDCKVDDRTGKYYYINHYTKTTTWEDPRNRHRPFQGTPKYFTSNQTEYIPLQDMRPRMSPLTVKSSKVVDTSLSAALDTDEAVAKIAAMFPTVPETHIRLLLKNYRYMKSIFPQADETIILDILQNNENNIQKASDILKDLGYTKTDTVKIALQKLEDKKEEKQREEEIKEARAATPQIAIKTTQEKEKLKADLQEKYKDVPEHLITIALESVNYDENRANQILQIMIQEDTTASDDKSKKEQEQNDEDDVTSLPTTSYGNLPVSQSRQSIKSLLKEKSDKEKEKSTFSRVIEERDENTHTLNLISTNGPNPILAKGPNEKLLLEDYVRWQGTNANLRKGPQGLAKGANTSLLSKRTYQPCGPNLDLRRGPRLGLAKGSFFSQLKTVVVGESRVK